MYLYNMVCNNMKIEVDASWKRSPHTIKSKYLFIYVQINLISCLVNGYKIIKGDFAYNYQQLFKLFMDVIYLFIFAINLLNKFKIRINNQPKYCQIRGAIKPYYCI